MRTSAVNVFVGASALAVSERRVICLDLRGHGESEWAESGYHISSFHGT